MDRLLLPALFAALFVSSAVASQPSDGWNQTARLTPDGPPDTGMRWFGFHCDIEGDLAVVSSPYVWGPIQPEFPDPIFHQEDVGAAWVFERVNGAWNQVAILRSPSPQVRGYFGWACAIIGDDIIVTAPLEQFCDPLLDPASCNQQFVSTHTSGRVHIFRRSPTTWESVQTLKPDLVLGACDGTALSYRNTELGYRIDHNDTDTVVLGASQEWWTDPDCPDGWPLNAVFRTGAAYVMKKTGTDWALTQRIDLGEERAAEGRFGSAVAINLSGDTIVVGAAFEPSDIDADGNPEPEVGATYIYERDPISDTYELFDRLESENPSPYGHFGFQVALTETPTTNQGTEESIFVSEPGADNSVDEKTSIEDAGRVLQYRYSTDLGVWYPASTLVAPDQAAYDGFGEEMMSSGDFLVIGSWGADRDTNADNFAEPDVGAGYVFYPTLQNDWNVRWSGSPSSEPTSPGLPNNWFGWPPATDGDQMLFAAPNADATPGNPFGGIGAVYVYENNTDDLDGDGLKDDWEMRGVPWQAGALTGCYPLEVGNEGYPDPKLEDPYPRADPWRKDIFIEIDTIDPENINWDALSLVRESFDQAPVGNADGSEGIALHYTDPQSVETISGIIAEFPHSRQAAYAAKLAHFGNADDYLAAPENAPEIREAKAKAFRWALFTSSIENGPAGFSSVPSDYMIFAGNFMGDTSDRNAASTFMHELGHSLGLHHGGEDAVNFKPNYVSVMNYNFDSLFSADRTRPAIDFSRETTASLDEADLDEPVGIFSPEYTNILVPLPLDPDSDGPLSLKWRWAPLDGSPIDWNNNKDPSESGVIADPNYLGAGYTSFGPWASPTPDEVLTGHNDWNASLQYAPVSTENRGTDDDIPVDGDYTIEFLEQLSSTIPPPPIPCTSADIAEPYNLLDLADINAFVAGFVSQDPIADLDANALFDLSDISLFISTFTTGCPGN